MTEADEDAGKFEFDPEQLGELGELAEAFIHEEVDADLFDELDRDYLEELVESAGSESPADINPEEYEAAIEVAELILERMDLADY
jgi:hypothetical protein